MAEKLCRGTRSGANVTPGAATNIRVSGRQPAARRVATSASPYDHGADLIAGYKRMPMVAGTLRMVGRVRISLETRIV
ncbi:hypothetical protein [Rhodoblastus sp.]|uniref:hypothetical protein n=1 Tax=Rhodoblastus sp. TaxID=1962975 RepID=UPI003F9D3CCF